MPAEGVDLDTVTAIFKKLKGTDERGEFIQRLLKSLPGKHVREIVGHVQSLYLYFDIIGNLPIEILGLIFQHLELYQAFQLRRVSKRWQQILSAPDLIENLLHPWDALGKVHLRMPPDISVEAALALKAEHVDAFRTGNPFSMVQGEWEVAPGNGGYPLMVSYSHGRLAWLDHSDRTLHVRNLEDGQEISCTPPDRARIDMLGLSSEIVAAITFSGKCYAWNIITGDPAATLQLSSASADFLAVTGSFVAIVQKLQDSNRHCVTVWSLDDYKTRSFEFIPRNSQSDHYYSYKLHILIDSIVILERVKGPPDEVFFTRFTPSGEIIAEGSSGSLHRTFRSGYEHFVVLPQPESEETMSRDLLDPTRPSINDDGAKLHKIRNAVLRGTCGNLCLVFDSRNNRLQALGEPAISCREFEIGPSPANYWYFWKNMAFRFCEDTPGNPLSAAVDLQRRTLVPDYTHRLNDGPWTTSGTNWPIARSESRSPSPAYEYDGSLGRRPIWFCGDDIYMIRVYPRGYTAFCFDKNITMANEDEMFRHQRSRLRKDRIRGHDQIVEKVFGFGQKTITELEAELTEYDQRRWTLRDGKNPGGDEQGEG
ncbi:MAG: hypothetical protein LQ349_002839 [Xanthoria aureola]|nr:MAG: hypothetical protein LQ349_002839 [Xanthoria aureola]